MTIIALITARGGSKGLPGKNLLPLAGKPLLAWTIEAALHSPRLDEVILSTDDAEIARVGREWGAAVPFMRPSHLAQDQSDHLSVVEHALGWLQARDGRLPNYLLLLQPTSPLRTAEDIEAAIQTALQHDAKAVVSVCEAAHHPYLTKRIAEDGTLVNFIEADLPYLRRQDLPPAYALNGAIYLNRPTDLLAERTFLPKGTYPYVMPPQRSFDIDTAWDLHLADLILRNPYDHP